MRCCSKLVDASTSTASASGSKVSKSPTSPPAKNSTASDVRLSDTGFCTLKPERSPNSTTPASGRSGSEVAVTTKPRAPAGSNFSETASSDSQPCSTDTDSAASDAFRRQARCCSRFNASPTQVRFAGFSDCSAATARVSSASMLKDRGKPSQASTSLFTASSVKTSASRPPTASRCRCKYSTHSFTVSDCSTS